MPRKEVHPLIRSLQAFETADLVTAEFALQVAQETVKRRKSQAAAVQVALKPAQIKKKKLAVKPKNEAKPIVPAAQPTA